MDTMQVFCTDDAKTLGAFSSALAAKTERSVSVGRLNSGSAKELSRLASASSDSVFFVDITGARKNDCDSLLDVAERSGASFRLFSSTPVPETLTSRASVTRLPGAREQEVRAFVSDNSYFNSPAFISRIAKAARGDLGKVSFLLDAQDSRQGALSVLQAFKHRRPSVLDDMARVWTEAHTRHLYTAASEAVTGNYQAFTEEEVSGVERRISLQIMLACSVNVRPSLVVGARLSAVWKEIYG